MTEDTQAGLLLAGEICQYCGCELNDGLDYPHSCPQCEKEWSFTVKPTEKKAVMAKTSCPLCDRKVKQAGLQQHVREYHHIKNLKMIKWED